MEMKSVNIEKTCCFYASDWHLSVMLVPHINKQIDEDVEITTIFKNSEEEKIKELVGKLNIKNANKILNINYEKYQNIDYEHIKEILINTSKSKKLEIIVSGNDEEIKKINSYIMEYYKQNDENNTKVNIVDCYNLSETEVEFKDKIGKYTKVLNTQGEHEIA